MTECKCGDVALPTADHWLRSFADYWTHNSAMCSGPCRCGQFHISPDGARHPMSMDYADPELHSKRACLPSEPAP